MAETPAAPVKDDKPAQPQIMMPAGTGPGPGSIMYADPTKAPPCDVKGAAAAASDKSGAPADATIVKTGEVAVTDATAAAPNSVVITGMSAAEGVSRPIVEASAGLTFKLRLKAKADKVFQALVDPASLTKWFCRTAEVEAKKDGKYFIGWQPDQATDWKVADIVPGKSLKILLPEPVTFTLAPDAEGWTRLEVVIGPSPDALPPVKEQVIWAIHLLYLKAYLDFGVDLRDPDTAKKWKDDFVNGCEA